MDLMLWYSILVKYKSIHLTWDKALLYVPVLFSWQQSLLVLSAYYQIMRCKLSIWYRCMFNFFLYTQLLGYILLFMNIEVFYWFLIQTMQWIVLLDYWMICSFSNTRIILYISHFCAKAMNLQNIILVLFSH